MMYDFSFWANVIGVITGIGGSLFSLFQAISAKKSASEARRYRDQLETQRTTSEISQLQSACRKAIRSIEKYGPASIPANLSGLNHESAATDAHEFVLLIREHRAYFGETPPNSADEFGEIIEPLIDSFAKSNTIEERRSAGMQILRSLSTMASIIKRDLDNRRNSVI